MNKKPVLEGRYWRMPDGGLVPNIAGGSDGEGDGDAAAGGTQGAPAADDGLAEANAEVVRLRKDLKDTRTEASGYRRKLRDQGDIDVEQYNLLIADADKRKQEDLEAKGNYDALTEENKRRFEQQLKVSNDTGDAWKGRYEKQVVDNVLLSAATEAVSSSEAVTLIRANYQFLVTDDGDVEIHDRAGKVLLDERGNIATTAVVMQEFLKDRPHMLKPQGGGGGSQNNDAVGKKPASNSGPAVTGSSRIAAALLARQQS